MSRRKSKKQEKKNKAAKEEETASKDETAAAKDLEIKTFTPKEMEELVKKAEERDEFKDRFQRAAADFSNYQKRAQREIDDIKKYASGSLSLDLLSVVDNFTRAIVAAQDKVDEDILQGVKMIEEQLLSVLKKHGVSAIEAKDKPFDPNFHEALMEVEDGALPDKTVVDELEKGYMHHDRLLRPTRVRVSRVPQKTQKDDEEGSE